MPQPYCPRCKQSISANDPIAFGGNQIVHLPKRPRRNFVRMSPSGATELTADFCMTEVEYDLRESQKNHVRRTFRNVANHDERMRFARSDAPSLRGQAEFDDKRHVGTRITAGECSGHVRAERDTTVARNSRDSRAAVRQR